jgi:hypothetical protein
MFVGRSGFSRDLCAIENQGFRVTEAAFIATLCVVEDRGSGLKFLLQKPPFVGAASTATLQDRGDEGCLLSLSDPFRGVSCRITTCNCPAILGRISQPSAELRNAVRTPPLLGPVTARLSRLPIVTSSRSRGFHSRLTWPRLDGCPNFFPKVSRLDLS